MPSSKVWNWGIIGTGRITSDFAGALKAVENAKLVAVGGSDLERAQQFATTHGVPRAYGTYEALAKDPEVEIVYVGTLHPAHKSAAIAALEQGKAVLVEKPFAMNAAEVAEMIEVARRNKTFMMEAMWTRYYPLTQKIQALIKEGRIGKIVSLDAQLGFAIDPTLPRLTSRQHGASSLLDVGVYPVSYANFILGPAAPLEVQSVGRLSPCGTFDVQFATVLKYASGLATVKGSFESSLSNSVTITGTLGTIQCDNFWCPTSFTLSLTDGTKQTFDASTNPEFALPDAKGHKFNFHNSSGLAHEAKYVQHALERGLKESELQSFEESLTIMKTMDSIAKQVGFNNYSS